MRNPRTLARDWCTTTGAPWSDLNGRLRIALEDKIIAKSAGRHSGLATPLDAAVLILATLVARLWKDVPAGIRRYGGLRQHEFGITADFPSRFGEDICQSMTFQLKDRTLLDALMLCLRTFRSDSEPEIGFVSLNIERSEFQGKASLILGDPPAQFAVHFLEPPREGIQRDVIVESSRMRGFALTVMADLLFPNLQVANDTGPSVVADEPVHPMLVHTLTKRPGLAGPMHLPWTG
jgi:hypothetical protein